MGNSKRPRHSLNSTIAPVVVTPLAEYQPSDRTLVTSDKDGTTVEHNTTGPDGLRSLNVRKDVSGTHVRLYDHDKNFEVVVSEDRHGLSSGEIWRTGKNDSNIIVDIIDETGVVAAFHHLPDGKRQLLPLPTERASDDRELLSETLKAGLDEFKRATAKNAPAPGAFRNAKPPRPHS